MRIRQAVAVAVCVAIVVGAYIAWDRVTANFNPNPSSETIDTAASCPPAFQGCPVFRIDSANLTVSAQALESEGYDSQELALRVTALGPSKLDGLRIFMSAVPVGNTAIWISNESAIVDTGESATFHVAISTTVNITQGQWYSVVVESFNSSSTEEGQGQSQFWRSIEVLAS